MVEADEFYAVMRSAGGYRHYEDSPKGEKSPFRCVARVLFDPQTGVGECVVDMKNREKGMPPPVDLTLDALFQVFSRSFY